jgi:hypothetical protein
MRPGRLAAAIPRIPVAETNGKIPREAIAIDEYFAELTRRLMTACASVTAGYP